MLSPNKAFEDELYFQYLRDPESVSKEWRLYFDKVHGSSVFPLEQKKTNGSANTGNYQKDNRNLNLESYEELIPLSPILSKIAENMEDSIEVPSASSVRVIPVKALDENRRVINKYLLKLKRPKVSFTNILLWALVKALAKHPHMNDAYARVDGKPHRIRRNSINVGLAIDVTKKDGTRMLIVPNVKNAQNLNFSEFIQKFEELISKTRNNKIKLDDLEGTTVTLTNPGMIGTTASSPRLMSGQGLILAVGAIDYPPEFQAVRPEALTNLAVSKVVTVTSTYDHRILQGAQSAEFLAYIHKLLIGEQHFYDQIFASLKIPFEPVRWQHDAPDAGIGGFYDHNKDISEKGAHVMRLINAYRVRGHLLASVNPLGLQSYYYPELDPAFYNFTIWDLDRVFHADDSWENNNIPLRDIIELMRETYCGPIGIEFMHIQDPEKKEWIKTKLELKKNQMVYSSEEKIRIYKKLVEAETFEDFLHTKYIGHKRFSLEGNESAIVLLDHIFENGADDNLDTMVIGMAHRGRLNVLVNNIGKSKKVVFNEFDGDIDPTLYQGSGDVKYHLGDEGVYISHRGGKLKVILSPNPSHLELVNPVIEGMARAIENEIKDYSYTKVLPILIHGDAAFAGQGIVAETLNLSELEGYKTGGTIHIIINNQIGFTTTIESSRSSVYATDIAKMIQCPIIHVNGNNPEAVNMAAEFAFQYRQKFHSDIIIDHYGYRKYGHNEADEPSYTQPLLYKKIKSMIPVREMYESELTKENVLDPNSAAEIRKEYKQSLDDAFAARKGHSENKRFIQKEKWGQAISPINTSVPIESIEKITDAITTVPDWVNINPKVLGGLKQRRRMFESKKPDIDWAMAEALAFGSILLDGNEIRFTGEDSRRGTFSQRHASITDMQTEEVYIPLNDISPNQAKLRIFDSPLSEMAVLGFEFGYSIIAKNSLTIWEAQFGDFANISQGIIDQFIACSEVKWGVTSNLVMLLPHGYDGQGPEHSSARLERFLQLCGDENMIVGNFTTPAQYFHALRRQVKLAHKMPLIIMTPKSMLRHPQAVSSVSDLAKGNFMHVIDDSGAQNPNEINRLIITSGKIYYDLLSEKLKQEKNDVAITRLEQLYPLNKKAIMELVDRYSNAKEILWVQEEPQNMGAWSYLFPELLDIIGDKSKLKYVGRKASASTSTGSYKHHLREQEEIVNDALFRTKF